MKALRALKKYFIRYKWLMMAGIVCVLISNLFRIVTPPITGWVIDQVVSMIKSGNTEKSVAGLSPFFFLPFKNLPVNEAVIYGVIALFVLAVLSGVFMFLMRQTLIVMSRNIEYDQKNDIYAHYQQLDAGFLQQQTTGDLMNRISEDVSRVRMFTGPALMYLINLFCVIGMSLYFMFRADSRLTLITLSPLPVLAFIIYRVNLIIQRQSDKIQTNLSQLTTQAQQAYSGIRAIKSYLREKKIRQFFSASVDDYTAESLRLSRVESVYFPSIALLMGISTLMTVGVGTIDIINGYPGAGVGHVVEFLLYIQMLMFPVSAIGWSASMIKRADVSQRRINEFLSYTPLIKDEKDGLTPALNGEIELRQLSFTYPGTSVQALKQIDLKIKAGERIAIVGKTGSGKTTLARILLRLYNYQEGEYFLDKQLANQLSLHHLRQQFAYVPQDIFLFSDSIRNNICFGSDEASEIKVWKVADLACLSQELANMKDGLQTIVGERGVTLSGGQRQRVAIARALLMENAVITLFDDCLSAVDAETEKQLFNNISGFLKQKTILFITHRLTQLADFDRIIVLDKGEVAETGTYQQLIHSNGLFHRLIIEQQMHINNP